MTFATQLYNVMFFPKHKSQIFLDILKSAEKNSIMILFAKDPQLIFWWASF